MPKPSSERRRTACGSSLNYQGMRKPSCNGGDPCDACIDIYVIAQAEKIMHNDLYGDPMLVKRLAGNIVEVMRQRKP